MPATLRPTADQVCIVTGATAGIGLVTARELAERGATVVLISRSAKKCSATVAALREATSNERISAIAADLSLMSEVRRAAAEFSARQTRLDLLVNNAGAYFMARQETAEGNEMTFALNHLNYFLLTNLLLDMLIASAPARIVNVSSDAHRGAKLNFADLQNSRRYAGFTAYGQSKLANILFTAELARRLEGTGVTTNSLHPGLVATNFAANNGRRGKLMRWVMNRFSISVEQGAQTTLYVATAPELEGVTGQYFESSRVAQPSAAARDADAARRLWEVSEQLVGLEQPA